MNSGSVEWLQAIELERDLTLSDWNKAKEMEKERIENAWVAALDFGIEKMKGLNDLESKDAFEQYYEQTYGGGEQ